MNTTTVGAAITAFIADISTACASLDPTIQVTDGPPIQYLAPDYVWVRGWEYDLEAPATLGGGPNGFQLDEAYTIDVTIRSWRGDSVQADSRAPALNIFAAIQTAVRNDPTLGGAIRVCWIDKGTAVQGVTPRGGTACEIEFSLRCEARLT